MLKQKFISIVKNILKGHPRLLTFAKGLRFKMWQLRVRSRANRWSDNLDVNQTYWVNPDQIEYACILKGYDKYGDRGKVIGGNWDQKRIRFKELDIFRAFDERFLYGRLWEETDFYQRILNNISNGTVKWGCRNKTELNQRCKYLEFLYQDIKANGYKSQEEISLGENDPYKGEDEITIRIGHDGALLFEDGRHRLAIATLLNIDKIPIKVTVRHLKWYQFRQEVIAYARMHRGKLYSSITHPDLSDIPTTHGEERFEIIKAHLPIQRGDLLDIGAHWGYFCHKFEKEGFNCYAIEEDAMSLYFLEKLKKAENRKFKIIFGSIFDYHDKTNFDVVLAFNIFHHFLKTEETYYRLIELLNRLETKIMFFQAHLPHSPQMKGAYRNYDCDEFVNFILENSILNDAIYINKAKDGRPIYMLQKI